MTTQVSSATAPSVEKPNSPPSKGAFAFPLSYAQQRLWFLEQLEPGQSTYNVPLGVRLSGRLEVEALRQTLAEVVRRHEVLRTRFGVSEGKPQQIVESEARVQLEVHELPAAGARAQETLVEQLAAAEAEAAFDLEHGPLLRARLLRLGAEEHVLLVTMHHIISDGWSMSVLVGEVAALYEAYRQGDESPLPELAIQYADFAVWQREWLGSGVEEQQLGYWRRQLGGELATLELATEQTRGLVASNRGERRLFAVEDELWRGLQELSRGEGVTLFMLLLAAWQTLLYRYTGETDVVVGTDVANRNRLETEGLIGFFVNQLVLRTDLSGEPSFRELLQRVREVCLGAYAHQDVPFERLVEELQPERSLSQTPLYQVMFVLQNAPQGVLQLPGLRLSPVTAPVTTAKFDLVLTLVESESGGLGGTVEYRQELFTEASMLRLTEHYRQLLASVVAQPAAPVSRLNLLSASEREQILVVARGTQPSYGVERGLVQRFEEQVAQQPEALAVRYGERQLSYRELNERANQVGHYLVRLGVGREVLVGLCLRRSVELVVGMLGILKAGGAYLPLDPSYPAERLQFMLEDGQVAVLLSEQEEEERLPAHWGQTISLDGDWELLAESSPENVGVVSEAEQLAYVIYTSGSSGVPKGVSVTQGAIQRLVCNSDYLQVSAGEVVAQASNASFDAATFEIWGALLNGGVVNGVSKEVMLNPEALAAQIAAEGINILFLTTALFNQVAEQAAAGFKGMKAILFGGQAVDPGSVRRIQEQSGPGRLLHVYGPTECTTYATWQLVREVADGARTVPIGKVLANTEGYILDGELELAPPGVVGELYLGGPGLARGYWQRPELSGEKFVPHPHSVAGGERLYATGDLVRYRSGWEIEFLGRVDEQVKVRGFRVELGEIEAVLREQVGVRECAVLALEKEAGEKQLAAYVVGVEGRAVAAGELRQYLREKLPDYMVPAVFVSVSELPLTANGKLDRKALLALSVAAASDAEGYEGPRTAVEEMLSGIYGEVLELGVVSRNESFFDLGGHSLLATQVISRVRELFQVELALRSLFERPTVAGLAEAVTEALGAGAGTATVAGIERADRSTSLPLSYAQQRLWFLDQLEPGSNSYNVQVGVRLSGRLAVEALRQTLAEVVRRHEVLRTRFAAVGGEPVQVIAEAVELGLAVEELSELGAEEQTAAVAAAVRAEAERGFDLQHGPLLRVRLLRLEAEEHVLLLTMHHIVVDGWSLGLLINEVATLYEAFLDHEPSPLPELPIQYSDFAVWQRRLLNSEVMRNHVEYWRAQLANAPAESVIPTDRPRPTVQTSRGAHESRILSTPLSESLKTLCRKEGVTLFMLMLAAWQVVLSRYARQEDILVGTDVANRNHLGTEGLVGFFVNMLVMRVSLQGDPPFTELLRRTREVCLEAYAHQDMPFEKLVEELQPERSLSRTPFFQIVFGLQNSPQRDLHLKDLTLSSLPGIAPAAKFDLNFGVNEMSVGIGCELNYNTDLFDAVTIQRILVHYERLLEEVVKSPDCRLSAIPLLSEDERRSISLWNDTRATYPNDKRFDQLFADQAQRTPEAVALVHSNTQLTYKELNSRANQVARYLRDLGAGPEVVVGLCLERSIKMIVGLLGILKAGAAYLPLDSTYPKDRLSFMLADARVPVLITASHLLNKLPAHDARVISLDSEWDQIACMDEDDPQTNAEIDNLAYVIYTSGSTGKPKGALITHRAVVNHNFAISAQYSLTASDRVLQFASLSFDVAVEEMFPTWLCGGAVVLRPENVLDSHLSFLEFLDQEEITVVNLSTPYWAEVMAELTRAHAQMPRSLRLAAIGGEKAVAKQFVQWKQLMGDHVQLMNVYGPTETTITNTVRELKETLSSEDSLSVPLGHPIANNKLFVLDQQLQLVPVGISGELYIGGESLGRGYLCQPSQTAESFIPDACSGDFGARLYKTGDLVRRLADGQIEFLGRVDQQAKVRGFRFELGEIETVLMRHEAIREAVVIVREDVVNDKRVVAYVVPEDHAQPTSNELRAYVRERLPEYMVPARFVMLKEMPLTANNKVDRRALPPPDLSNTELSDDYVAPRTQTEEIVAGIWSTVLQVEPIGVNDDFFLLGGHSLLATQAISRIRESFRLDIPLQHLFEYSRVAAFSQIVDTLRQEQTKTEVPPIVPALRTTPLPLSFAQQRLWFVEQLQPGSLINNMPFAVRLEGQLNVDALRDALSEIIRRHEVLRTTFGESNGQPIQIIQPPEALKLEVEELGESGEREAERYASEEAAKPFDLSRGPLLRVRLLRLAENDHVVLLTLHHIVCDGWSIGLLISEIAALYDAYANGRPSPLPELPVQYADFAVWQRRLLRGKALERQLNYWRQKLGRFSALELRTDRPRPLVQSYRGAGEPFSLPPDLAAQLKDLSQREGVTLFMLLLAALQLLLHRYTRQTEIIVGADVANRTRIETEGLIGYFINLLVLRTDFNTAVTFHDLLEQVRQTTLEAFERQEVPFEKLVEELRPERDISRNPLVQVVLSVQNTPAANLELPKLKLTTFNSAETQTRSQWDLALFMWETAQGLGGSWKYNSDLFFSSTITRMSGHLETLLRSVVTDPHAKLDKLEFLTEAERSEQETNKSRLQRSRFDKFKNFNPEPDSIGDDELIKTSYLDSEKTLPLFIQPTTADCDIVDWARNNREFLQTSLQREGALLFRGCRINRPEAFENLALAICPELFGEYGDLPRAGIGGKVYGSTPYPEDQTILFHNESSHLHHWPLKIFFHCVIAAEQGGETPLVDGRKMLGRLDPKIREQLAQRKLMYVRNFTEGLDVTWRDFFHTNDKAVVEEQCRKNMTEVEWLDGNRLRTQRVCPAIARHAISGEPVFFNQILLHHVLCLEPAVRQSMLSLFDEENFPRQVYYGDGSPIENSVVETIRELYWRTAAKFPWQEGDVLAVDNMLVAHARMPFKGPRKILVAMGEMITER